MLNASYPVLLRMSIFMCAHSVCVYINACVYIRVSAVRMLKLNLVKLKINFKLEIPASDNINFSKELIY